MKDKKVVSIEELKSKRIILTGAEVMAFSGPGNNPQGPSQHFLALMRAQNASPTNGKMQYWLFRISKEIMIKMRDLEEQRVAAAHDYCKRNKKGDPIFTDSTYSYKPEKEALRQTEIDALSPEKKVDAKVIEKINLKYCEKEKDGSPVMVGGTNLAFEDDKMKKYQEEYMELMAKKITLEFDKIPCPSDFLEKMNAKGTSISVQDMGFLESIIDFKE